MGYFSADLARRVCSFVCLWCTLLACSAGLSAEQQPAPPSAEQSPAPAAQAAPRKPPPFPNRANEVMPSWLRVRGEFRERVEGFENAGFVGGRDDTYFLSRFRFTATATGKVVGATVQMQDARVGDKSVGPTGAPFKAPFDFRQAFADIGIAKAPVVARSAARSSRSATSGSSAHANWLNTARSFDAARVTVRGEAGAVRCVRRLGRSDSRRRVRQERQRQPLRRRVRHERPRSCLRGRPSRTCSGVATSTSAPKPASLGTLQQVTTGARLVGKLPARLDYNVEMDAPARLAWTRLGPRVGGTLAHPRDPARRAGRRA